ncbi:MAG: tetratricopeptide repeat protein [Bacteroidetes bacterium]|nr:tetratricopeptide repeat protein [Bacteroidota bacterium]
MKRKPIFRTAIMAIVVSLCCMLPKANAQNMDKGLHLLELDQFHKAAVIFKEFTKQTPAPVDAWFYLGECYLRLDRADSAMICFNTGRQTDDKNPSYLAGLGMVSFLKNNPADAKLNFVNASKLSLKKYPNGIVSILKGYAYCKFPVDEFITGIYKKGQEAKVQNAQVHLAWGEINTNVGNTSEAASAYQRALAADEKNISAHYRLGQMYNSARNYSAAIAEIESALQMDANYYPAIREKADALFKMNKFDAAAKLYEQYISLTEESVYSLTKYAEVLFFDKKYDKANEIITKILKLDPNNAVMLRLMGYTSYETGKDKEGIEAMTRYFQIRKDSTAKIITKDYENFAKMLERAGQDSLAVYYYQKTMVADESKKSYIENIGNLLGKQKKFLESAEALEQAQQLRSGISGVLQSKIGTNYYFASTLLPASDSLKRKELLVKADSAFSRVTQTSPNSWSAFLWRARIANIADPKGDLGLAKPFYEKTLQITELKPDERKKEIIEAAQYLGYQQIILREKAVKEKDKVKTAEYSAAAVEYFKKIVALDPSNNDAADAIKQLTAVPKKPAPAKK